MYVRTYVHTLHCIHPRAYTQAYLYMHYRYIYIYIYIYVYICMYVHTYMRTCIHTLCIACIHVHTHRHTYTCITDTCTCTCSYIHIIRMHTCIHIIYSWRMLLLLCLYIVCVQNRATDIMGWLLDWIRYTILCRLGHWIAHISTISSEYT